MNARTSNKLWAEFMLALLIFIIIVMYICDVQDKKTAATLMILVPILGTPILLNVLTFRIPAKSFVQKEGRIIYKFDEEVRWWRIWKNKIDDPLGGVFLKNYNSKHVALNVTHGNIILDVVFVRRNTPESVFSFDRVLEQYRGSGIDSLEKIARHFIFQFKHAHDEELSELFDPEEAAQQSRLRTMLILYFEEMFPPGSPGGTAFHLGWIKFYWHKPVSQDQMPKRIVLNDN